MGRLIEWLMEIVIAIIIGYAILSWLQTEFGVELSDEGRNTLARALWFFLIRH